MAHLAGILLFINDHDGILLSLPLCLCQSLFHLSPLSSNHLKSLLFSLCYCFLDLVHGLTLNLIHRLFYISGEKSGLSLARLVLHSCTVHNIHIICFSSSCNLDHCLRKIHYEYLCIKLNTVYLHLSINNFKFDGVLTSFPPDLICNVC